MMDKGSSSMCSVLRRFTLAETMRRVVPGGVFHWSFAHRGRWGPDKVKLSIGAPDLEMSQGIFTDSETAWGRYSGSYIIPDGVLVARFAFDQIFSTGCCLSAGNFLDSIGFAPALTACDSAVSTPQNTAVLINPLVGSSAPGNISLAITLGPTINGNLTVNHNNTVRFVPNSGFVGVQVFEFQIVDEYGCNSTAQVNVTVG